MSNYSMRAFEAYINQAFWGAIEPHQRIATRLPPDGDEEQLAKPYGPGEAFARLASIGRRWIRENPLIWPDLVRVFMGPIQAGYLTADLLFPDAYHNQVANPYEWGSILFGRWINDRAPHFQPVTSQVTLNLGVDMVLPWPWHSDRYMGALNHIGTPTNPWTQDLGHHRVYALWPLGVAVVGGGNHSLAAGIIHRTGSLQVGFIDMRPWLADLQTDGLTFYNKHGEIVSRNPSPFWAALWELSRIIVAQHSSEKILWGMSGTDADAIAASASK